MVIEYFLWTTSFLMLLYLLLLLVFTLGWLSIKSFQSQIGSDIFVSVLVAVRNEEENIVSLLRDLKLQNMAIEQFEICIVDDHSEDETIGRIQQFKNENPEIQLRLINAENQGKKAALEQGISASSGGLIVCTDGDCRMDSDWLQSIVAFYKIEKAVLILAPVVYHEEVGALQKMFSLDFMSLVASGAGSAGAGLAFMGNGANIAFSRRAWEKAKGNGDHYASGDDVFLIQKIVQLYGHKAVRFLKSQDATVRTHAPLGFQEFLQQRVRWASKAKGYKSPWAIFVTLLVFAVNLCISITFFTGFIIDWFFIIFGLFVVLKMLIDLPLLLNFSSYFNKSKLVFWIVPLSFIYPVYIVVAAFQSLFLRFEWKGRAGLK